MSEVVVIPTLGRPELLYCCLRRIRAAEPKIPIHIFPDRGTFYDEDLRMATKGCKNLHLHFVGDNPWYGNSANAMECLRWAFNAGFYRTFYIESDVMIHEDFFSWHRTQHEMFSDIFASMGWVFNHHAPITDDLLFQPWYYAIGTCFSRSKLELVARHACPKYYSDMQGYMERTFGTKNLFAPFGIQHYEHDGLIQRILMHDGSQTVAPGIAKCSHMGFVRSYGRVGIETLYEEFFANHHEFARRVEVIESLIADHYWRASVFGKAIVEREVGRELPPRNFRYKIRLKGGWESDVVSDLDIKRLPKRLNSVPLPSDAEIVLA